MSQQHDAAAHTATAVQLQPPPPPPACAEEGVPPGHTPQAESLSPDPQPVGQLAVAALCALCEVEDDKQLPLGQGTDDENARAILGDVLISRLEPCSEKALAAIDAVYAVEGGAPGLAPTEGGLPGASWFKIGTTKLAVWRGDIRDLAVGAVVNAANDSGLGCFQPLHRCIDNILHRAAGPRLREECRCLMAQRGPLVAGSPPMLTSGYHLNAAHVLHVTGPQISPRGRTPTDEEQATLARCYTGCLDAAAAAGIRSIAFCCISAGLFGYPAEAAAATAVSTVGRWLMEQPTRQRHFDAIIFDVFTDEDAAAYARVLEPTLSRLPRTNNDLERITAEIAACDRLLIVAAAGLSINDIEPNNPYHSADDFARHYPAATRYGYRTAYEAMTIGFDARVPVGVRLAHMANHFLNMRFRFPPTRGYEMLRRIAGSFADGDVFCWTSNVDGCFERAGFDATRIYQCQGEMRRLQCSQCSNVWDCVEQLRAISGATNADGECTDLSLAPDCPRCGSRWVDGNILPNLRGGGWFIHAPYEDAQARLLTWLDESVEQRRAVAIMEIGVGGNTPIVTRVPTCAFASALKANGGTPTYLRVNPDPPERERDHYPIEGVSFHHCRQTWTALASIVDGVVALRATPHAGGESVPRELRANGASAAQPLREAAQWQQRYRDIMLSLRTPRD